MMKKILLIEDDPEIVKLLKIHLSDLIYTTEAAYDGEKGLALALAMDFDLILLDLSLPKLDGIEVCKHIRKVKNTPIIMLTAKSEEIDKVIGLEVGADDYLTKPFSIRELMARIKALLRRVQVTNQPIEDTKSLIFDALEINIEKRKVVLNGAKIELSPKEFELLVLMASNPGRNYSRTELLNIIWGYNFEGYEHTVNSHINRLRAKIETDMSAPSYILTTWGVGYKFNEDLKI